LVHPGRGSGRSSGLGGVAGGRGVIAPSKSATRRLPGATRTARRGGFGTSVSPHCGRGCHPSHSNGGWHRRATPRTRTGRIGAENRLVSVYRSDTRSCEVAYRIAGKMARGFLGAWKTRGSCLGERTPSAAWLGFFPFRGHIKPMRLACAWLPHGFRLPIQCQKACLRENGCPWQSPGFCACTRPPQSQRSLGAHSSPFPRRR